MKKEDTKNKEMLWKDKDKKKEKQQKEELLYGNEPQLTDDEKIENKEKMLTEKLEI